MRMRQAVGCIPLCVRKPIALCTQLASIYTQPVTICAQPVTIRVTGRSRAPSSLLTTWSTTGAASSRSSRAQGRRYALSKYSMEDSEYSSKEVRT